MLDFAYCTSEIAPGGFFCFLSFESMIERNYLILPVSSSCLFVLRVSRLYGGTLQVKLLFLRKFSSDQGFP